MQIKKLQIQNYKSFKLSEPIELGKGFNVIVGQNNSGKTALLECICPRLMQNNLHKELQDGRPALQNPSTVVHFDLLASGPELRSLLLSRGGEQTVYLKSTDVAQAREELDRLWGEPEILFRFRYTKQNDSWVPTEQNSHGARLRVNDDRTQISFHSFGPGPGDSADIAFAKEYSSRTYLSKAERLSLGQHGIGNDADLEPNAQNLALAILHLQTRRPGRFARLNAFLRQIFPSIHGISAKLENNTAILRIWTIDASQEFEELAINLADSGTGVGQAIAILYIVVNSDFPRVIVIDEPNSFLHPSAARALLRILRDQPHQYILSTHAAEIIAITEPTTLHLIRWDGTKSVVDVLAAKQVQDIRRALTNVGVRLSDVFGADQILWVEGQTEQECFPILLKQVGKELPTGLAVVAVRSTGDFEGRKPKAALIWQIYRKLCESNALLPPALGFSFDREGRTDLEIEDMRRESKNKVSFLPRKTYENYLIEPLAISHLLGAALGTDIKSDAVSAWLNQHGGETKYEANASWTGSIEEENWTRDVHGAKLLSSLVADLSEAKLEFQKPSHSILLTEWLLANKPDHLSELISYVTGLTS